MKLAAPLLLAALLIVGGLVALVGFGDDAVEVSTTEPASNASVSDSSVVPADSLDAAADSGAFTLAQVAEHDNEDDCWMVISGNVYDATEYIARHPGGKQIISGCGVDATSLFNDKNGGDGHSSNANSLLEDFLIGSLATN